jgi:hypothetical protein
MSRNVLYIVIVVLAVAALGLGYKLYSDQQHTSGIHIDIGKGGASIETK